MDTNFNDPAIMWAIGTVTFLLILGTIIFFRIVRDLIEFRDAIQPGEYAKVKTPHGMIRAKLVERNVGKLLLFQSVDDKQIILTAKSNIYQP